MTSPSTIIRITIRCPPLFLMYKNEKSPAYLQGHPLILPSVSYQKANRSISAQTGPNRSIFLKAINFFLHHKATSRTVAVGISFHQQYSLGHKKRTMHLQRPKSSAGIPYNRMFRKNYHLNRFSVPTFYCGFSDIQLVSDLSPRFILKIPI